MKTALAMELGLEAPVFAFTRSKEVVLEVARAGGDWTAPATAGAGAGAGSSSSNGKKKGKKGKKVRKRR